MVQKCAQTRDCTQQLIADPQAFPYFPIMRSMVVVLCMTNAIGISADFLAGQTVDVNTYNNELYLEGAGSYQRILYEDAMNSTMTTNMIWSEIYVAPCGVHAHALCLQIKFRYRWAAKAAVVWRDFWPCEVHDLVKGPCCGDPRRNRYRAPLCRDLAPDVACRSK